jgi:hypothetical protein
MCVVVLHVVPVGQSVLARHWTHRFVGTLQTRPPPPPPPVQSPFARHCTHRIVDVLQTGRPPIAMQFALVVQVVTQVFVAVSQASPVAQSEFARHPTHEFVDVSQT